MKVLYVLLLPITWAVAKSVVYAKSPPYLNMEGKSSTQGQRFLSLLAHWKCPMSDASEVENFVSPTHCKFATSCDWNEKISQNYATWVFWKKRCVLQKTLLFRTSKKQASLQWKAYQLILFHSNDFFRIELRVFCRNTLVQNNYQKMLKVIFFEDPSKMYLQQRWRKKHVPFMAGRFVVFPNPVSDLFTLPPQRL